MPLPYLPTDYEHLHTYWNRHQNRYKYRDQGRDMNLLRTMRSAYYAAAISFIDYQVGRILDYLEAEGEIGQYVNLVHVRPWVNCSATMTATGKRSFLDAAARIPLLVRYPERFEPNAQCDTPTSLVDVLPTCLGAAELPLQADRSGADSR